MEILFSLLRKFIAVILSLIVPVTSATSLAESLGEYDGPFTPKDAENIKLNFATISDLHMTDSVFREGFLQFGLEDMQNSEAPLDLLLTVGDNTDHGNTDQYEALKAAFEGYKPAKNIMLAVGNHDTWNNEEDGDNRFPESRELYLKYYNEICGEEINEVYHAKTINGYRFILLSSEYDNTSACISDMQLQWFENEMAAASKAGLPIFVVCHWPINQTHGLPETWGDSEPEPDDGGLGEQSDAVYAILTKYAENNDVFYITGHIHSGFTNDEDGEVYNYNSVERYGRLTLVNLPCYMYLTYRGRVLNGTGYQFEVYDDCVEIRARNYITGVWYTLYDYTIPLVKAD